MPSSNCLTSFSATWKKVNKTLIKSCVVESSGLKSMGIFYLVRLRVCMHPTGAHEIQALFLSLNIRFWWYHSPCNWYFILHTHFFFEFKRDLSSTEVLLEVLPKVSRSWTSTKSISSTCKTFVNTCIYSEVFFHPVRSWTNHLVISSLTFNHKTLPHFSKFLLLFYITFFEGDTKMPEFRRQVLFESRD